MPTETPSTPTDTSVSESFLKTTPATDSSNPYGDFFQETSDGNISIGAKVKKSGLELGTDILGYVVPIARVIAIVGVIHVFIRTQESNTFAENYSFICPYLNMGIVDPTKECKTLTMLKKEYDDRLARLQLEIVTGLTEYIPIKISKNIIDASPEKGFIIKTFDEKVHVDDIIKQFEKIRTGSEYRESPNIECNGISITNGDTLSTQCTIYGGKIGMDDSNSRLGSARIEALSFLETLANTARSQFILLNPPSSLNVEILKPGEDTTSILFETKTTVQIQVRYVPFSQKS
jgi:hypothetical protein